MSAVPSGRLTLLAEAVMVFLMIGSTFAVSAQPPAAVALTSPNPQYYGEFGYSVAISGNVVVVGAPQENVGGYTYAGRAYILNAETGALMATLTSPNSQYYGEFGYFVAISGNVVTVGGDGNAYLFNATAGALRVTLSSPNSQDYGELGISGATSGSVAVVGVPQENVSGYAYAGRANISNAETGAVVATLTSPNSQDFGEFGYSVAASGGAVVIDAPGETVGGNSSAGRAYVFNAESGALTATLTSPNSQDYGDFGYSVAMSGSIAVVGAPGETVSGNAQAGRAYIFDIASTASTSSSTTTSISYPSTMAIAGSNPTTLFVAGAAVVVIAVTAWGLVLRTRRMKQRTIEQG